jgi:hypothetical protein
VRHTGDVTLHASHAVLAGFDLGSVGGRHGGSGGGIVNGHRGSWYWSFSVGVGMKRQLGGIKWMGLRKRQPGWNVPRKRLNASE